MVKTLDRVGRLGNGLAAVLDPGRRREESAFRGPFAAAQKPAGWGGLAAGVNVGCGEPTCWPLMVS